MVRRFAGIDGCPAGWFCVQLGESKDWDASILSTDDIGKLAKAASRIFIDIPIGLVDARTTVRMCDKQARSVLGAKRASSVFPVPARESLNESSYKRALAANRRVTGRGISKQSWAIASKIKAIDDLVRADTRLRRKIYESHPEVCFWSLNNGQPLLSRKKTRQGHNERMALLRPFLPNADDIFDYTIRTFLRRQVARDDVVDALVLAVIAKLGNGAYGTFPKEPVHDAFGLPMQMNFFARDAE